MTYIALTTEGSSWWVVTTGEKKDAVQEQAERQICGDQWDKAKDIYVDTQLKNLVVVSQSQARRRFRLAMRRYEEE